MSEEIKARRFCGGKARWLKGVDLFYVECRPYIFMGPDCDFEPQAIAGWNEANTVEPRREEGVVAWMPGQWRYALANGAGVSACPNKMSGIDQKVRIIPEPEPRYAVERWGPKGAKVVDKHEFVHGRAFYDDHHPDPWGAAYAHAEWLNKREQQGGE